MVQDLRYALRLLRRQSGFSATAVLIIAIGVGATTAVFSVVYNVLLQPLPYPHADRLVRVWEENPGSTTNSGAMTGNRWLSNRTFFAWMEHPRTIDLLGSYSSYQDVVEIRGETMGLLASPISPALLAGLAGQPILGRVFTPSEGEQPAAAVAILSERVWRDRFGADPTVIGQRLVIDSRPHTVVGVLPSAFHFPERDTQLWTPFAIPQMSSGTIAPFTAVARLRSGMTPAQAEAEATAAARSVPRPESATFFFGSGGEPVVVHARRLDADVTTAVRPSVLVLAAAVGLLLLVGCANVANLLLSRGVARQREIALRSAIGASGGRVARQLLTESAILAFAGGVIGVGIAWVLVRLIPLLAPATFPRLTEIQLNPRVLSFAVVATILTALVTGVIPAIRGTRLNVIESLRGGDGASAGGFRGPRATRWRDTLLVAEAAFAVVLLVGANLLAHSFVRLLTVDNGYDAEHVLAAHVRMPRGGPPERTGQLIAATLERMRATSGVLAAGAGNMMPFVRMTAIASFTVLPQKPGAAPIVARALTYTITPGYAEALRLRLRAGRVFDEHDSGWGVTPMLVNEEFVRQYLQDGAAVGRRLEDIDNQGSSEEIVGVVDNVLKDGNDKRPQPEVYLVESSHRQFQGLVSFVLRTSGDPASVAGILRTTIQTTDRGAVIDTVEPLTSDLASSIAGPRFSATVLGIFAGIGLMLAALGLYSVLSHAVSQRRRELGVRSALGATKHDLIVLVLQDGLRVTAIGIVLGLAGAAAMVGFLRAALFGITPHDPVAFAIAPAIVLPIAVVACMFPALRAATVDPSEALRAE
jgi:putative ABC transport system permease protein